MHYISMRMGPSQNRVNPTCVYRQDIGSNSKFIKRQVKLGLIIKPLKEHRIRNDERKKPKWIPGLKAGF